MTSMGGAEVQEGTKTGEEGGGNPRAMVTFPPAARRNQNFPPPLKLEVEEESAETTSPRNMWQVYALGGFMVGRWIWARWRERRDREGRAEGPSD